MRIFMLAVVVGLSLFLMVLSLPAAHATSNTVNRASNRTVSGASSSSSQVVLLLRQAAARNGLPANLLMAIAWAESHWNQAARGWDGEIGVMQLIPATARGLNAQAHTHYNPYLLAGNIALGAFYLRSLWHMFHGNLVKVISAYNEGGWGVAHWGIRNWRYVNGVLALMRRF